MIAAPPVPSVIDLDAARPHDLDEACRTTGVFLVANHDVPASLLATHLDLARTFFALSEDDKRAIEVERGTTCFRGYEPAGIGILSAADWREGFIMGPDLAPDHPHVVAALPNTGANRWPAALPELRAHMERYVDAMNALARRIAGRLAQSLDLPADTFTSLLREPLTYSQLFRYPSASDAVATETVGAGAHVDWGMLTILLQDDVGGLEVRAADGTWLPVPPVPGTFVVILGELMLRLTSGRYRSAVHRVARNTSGRSRYSMPTFIDPGYDEHITPALTVADHLRAMAVRTLTDLSA